MWSRRKVPEPWSESGRGSPRAQVEGRAMKSPSRGRRVVWRVPEHKRGLARVPEHERGLARVPEHERGLARVLKHRSGLGEP